MRRNEVELLEMERQLRQLNNQLLVQVRSRRPRARREQFFVCLFVCLYAATRTNTQTHTAFHAVAALQRHAEEERRQLELLARNDPAKLAEIAKLDTLLGEVLLSGN